jgi:hypothetical protein
MTEQQTDATNELLTDAQKAEMSRHFDALEHEYRESDATDADVVYEDDRFVVVADHTGHELNEWADDFDLDAREFSIEMHRRARALCDHNWSTDDPVVFEQTEDN